MKGIRVPFRQYAALLGTYLRPQWKWMGALGVLVLTTIGLRLLNPQILRGFIDTATSGGSRATLVRSALLYFGIAVSTQGLAIGATYVGETVAWTATNALRLNLLRHALHLDAPFHKEYTPGQLIERIDGDVQTLSNFFSRFAIDILGNVIMIGGILGLLFREDWRIGLPIFAFSAMTLAVLIWIRKLAIPYWTKYRKMIGEFFGFLGEHLAGTEDIRANGAEQHVFRRFFDFTRRIFPVRLRSALAGYSMWMSSVVLFAMGHAVAFSVGGALWSSAAISIGTVYLVFHYTELLAGPISEIRTQVTDLQQAEAGIRRVRTMLETAPQIVDVGTRALPAGPLAVEFRDVSFSYQAAAATTDEEEEPLQGDMGAKTLEQITFALEPGQVLGLLGRTGSGKTTLARLLVRLYDCSKGRLAVGGIPIQEVRLAQLRSAVRLVPQEVHLFRATIRDNVRLFDRRVTDRRILEAMERLELGSWLRSLPNGLDTTLESGGAGLSAGQGQLLALARAFLAQPGVVILDEASSRLDPATETLLEHAVDHLLENRTAIVIAHRLSTVERADRILVLEGGAIAEYGDRRLLEADPSSRLSQLLRTGLEEVLA